MTQMRLGGLHSWLTALLCSNVAGCGAEAEWGQAAPSGTVTRSQDVTSRDCTRADESYTDPNTHQTWSSVYYCHNSAGAPLYAEPSSGTVVGYMDTRTSWFACYAHGAVH